MVPYFGYDLLNTYICVDKSPSTINVIERLI